MKTSCLLLICLCFNSLLFGQVPVINSFSPVSGPAGTVVTITGNNFSPVAGNNIVYFGSVKAVVMTASDTVLTVSVPVSATYSPITVTCNNLTGYASGAFVVTFDNGAINSNSFDTTQIGMLPDQNSSLVITADLDSDGKPDIITANGYDGGLSVYRNQNTESSFVFSNGQNIYTTQNIGGCDINFQVDDMDGDGRKDIVYMDGCNARFLIFKNTSTTGSLSFETEIPFALTDPGIFATFCIADIDADGKPDFIKLSLETAMASIYRNTGTPGAMSFAPAVNISVGYNPPGLTDPRVIIATDFNDDNKPDFAVTQMHSGYVYISRNISTPGNISFTSSPAVVTDLGAYWVAAGDLDRDGKKDIVVVSNDFGYRTTSILRNTSTASDITFAERVYYSELNTGPLVITDMDGDSKPDIIIKNYNSGDSIFMRINNSSPGNIDFSDKLIFELPGGSLAVGDLNSDSMPDIALGGGAKMIIFKRSSHQNKWTGTINQEWENPGNWSMNRLPDSTTNVIIPAGAVTINSNITINTLTVNPGATVTVAAGYTLTVLH